MPNALALLDTTRSLRGQHERFEIKVEITGHPDNLIERIYLEGVSCTFCNAIPNFSLDLSKKVVGKRLTSEKQGNT